MNKVSSTRRARVTEQDDEAKRADMVGATVRHLEGKAREYAITEFFAESVPSVRGEKVVKQSGMPPDLEIL